MPFGLFADAVLVLHLGFVAFVLGGGLLVLRWPAIAWLHVPAAAWGAIIEYAGLLCPLTPLEGALRARGGQAGYSGGFVEHYVTAALYPDGLTRRAQIVLGTLVLAINLTVYAHVLAERWWRRS